MKAVFSRIVLNDMNSTAAIEFAALTGDLIHHPKVQELTGFGQHLNTTRFQHSLNVAYYSFLIAKKLNLDVESCVRGGLLHDLFLYDWHTDQPVEGRHVNVHPQQALLNAKSITEVSGIMEDVIINHMWPMGSAKPKSREAWLIQGVDKGCALAEFINQSFALGIKYNLSPMMLGFLIFIR